MERGSLFLTHWRDELKSTGFPPGLRRGPGLEIIVPLNHTEAAANHYVYPISQCSADGEDRGLVIHTRNPAAPIHDTFLLNHVVSKATEEKS